MLTQLTVSNEEERWVENISHVNYIVPYVITRKFGAERYCTAKSGIVGVWKEQSNKCDLRDAGS